MRSSGLSLLALLLFLGRFWRFRGRLLHRAGRDESATADESRKVGYDQIDVCQPQRPRRRFHKPKLDPAPGA
jgi:hypothetical protein